MLKLDPSVYMFLSGIVGAFLLYLGTRFTASQSRGASDTATAVAAWKEIAIERREEMAGLNAKIDTFKAEAEARATAQDGEIAKLRAELVRVRKALSASRTYVDELLRWIDRYMPTGVPAVPDPPQGFTLADE